MSILILKNATAAQIYPAKVWENVDIAIENDKILAVGPGPVPALSAGAGERDARAAGDARHGLLAQSLLFRPVPGIQANIAPSPDFISTLKNLWWRLDRRWTKSRSTTAG